MTKLSTDAPTVARPITIVHAHDDSLLQTWTVTSNKTTDRPSTFDDLRQSLARTPNQLRSIAYLGDEPVGTACAVPNRLKQDGSMFTSLRVVKEHRHHGVGSALYDDLVAWMRANDSSQYEITVRDIVPDALAFWQRRGCKEIERDVIVALDVRDYRGATAPAPGVHIVSLAERPDLLRDIYEVGAATWPDIPVHEPENVISFDEWREIIETYSENRPEAVFAAIHGGDVVGYAHIALPDNMPEVGWHNFTGVVRAHRGRGIARSLKLHTIAWAKRNGRVTLMTGNHEDNAPMRHINDTLGYRRLYADITLKGSVG